jgi:hypothetical protein
MMTMFDPNMQVAFSVGAGLAHGPLELPAPLADVDRRTEFILQIDRPLLVDADGVAQWVEFGRHLQSVAEFGREVMPGLGGQLDRVSVAFRLWSGCLMAVKTIAHETRAGPNTASGRAEGFAAIDALAAEDVLFRAGVEAAPAFLAARGQSFCLDGVPEGSAVRRHLPSTST